MSYQKAREVKHEIINKIIKTEGGYVNDPNDSGGATNYGITIAVARAYGYKGDMRRLPRSMAFRIYSSQYWDKNKLTKIAFISTSIAAEVADTGVNLGTIGSAKIFQRTLNYFNYKLFTELKVDGKIGRKSISALIAIVRRHGKKHDIESAILKILNALQGIHYVEIAERYRKNRKFSLGWALNRL